MIAASASVLGDLDNNCACSKAVLLSVYANSVGRYIDEPASLVGGGHLLQSSTESFLLFFGLTRIFLPTPQQYIDIELLTMNTVGSTDLITKTSTHIHPCNSSATPFQSCTFN